VRLARIHLLAALAVLAATAGPERVGAEGRLAVSVHPPRPRIGDVAWIHVRGGVDGATVEGAVAGRPLTFFSYAGGHAALVGLDVDTRPGAHRWQLAVLQPGREPATVRGQIQVEPRGFPVQRLTLPKGMVDLDPETERRAVAEGERLRTLYRTLTPSRLWRGRFTRPVAGDDPGSGFGSRRVINGQPRAPHTGLDYAAPRGTPVVASNSGRVALVADYFFPGRLVVLDHGLGLYTLYFHLDSVAVVEDERVERGQPIGKVGATGRATGPHLHFGVQVGAARVDPASLFRLTVLD
jgi:murein DD-endopeptidase MepM/ murein hydrolase activator NlpD